MDLVLNNLRRLICRKTQTTNQIEQFDPITVCIYKMCLQIIYLIYMYKKGFGIK